MRSPHFYSSNSHNSTAPRMQTILLSNGPGQSGSFCFTTEHWQHPLLGLICTLKLELSIPRCIYFLDPLCDIQVVIVRAHQTCVLTSVVGRYHWGIEPTDSGLLSGECLVNTCKSYYASVTPAFAQQHQLENARAATQESNQGFSPQFYQSEPLGRRCATPRQLLNTTRAACVLPFFTYTESVDSLSGRLVPKSGSLSRLDRL